MKKSDGCCDGSSVLLHRIAESSGFPLAEALRRSGSANASNHERLVLIIMTRLLGNVSNPRTFQASLDLTDLLVSSTQR
jgi:hypothetical protein